MGWPVTDRFKIPADWRGGVHVAKAVLVGGHSFFDYEIQVARFLERGGWNVSYMTDVDVAKDPGDEYCSKEQFDGFERARGSGVNLAFLGAGAAEYQVRYEDGGRTMVSHKSQSAPCPDPRQKKVRFRDLNPTVLFHLEGVGRTPSADSVTYRMSPRSTVFAAGSLQFSWTATAPRSAMSTPACSASRRM